MPYAFGTKIYADSSNSKKGIVIYDGPKNYFLVPGVKYHTSFVFTIECTDSQSRKYTSTEEKKLKIEPPRVNMELKYQDELLFVNVLNADSWLGTSYMLTSKPVDSAAPDIPILSNNGEFCISHTEIGQYYQYRVSCNDLLGTRISSSYSLPTLCTKVVFDSIGPDHKDIFPTLAHGMDILSYLKQYNKSPVITSCTQDSDDLNQDFKNSWIEFDFGIFSVQLGTIKQAHSFNWSVEGSDDGMDWTIAHGGPSGFTTNVLSTKSYSMLRIIGASNPDFKLYGTLTVPFALTNKMGEKLYHLVHQRRYTDILVQ
jgi:hypothetical protein